MRIIHTSDWHLGRRLLGIDLSEAHRTFLTWLTDLVAEYTPDALVVAGDIFDRSFPSENTVEMLDDALVELTAHTHVVMTPGNHDSATRLGFTSRLSHERLHIRYRLEDLADPMIIPARGGEGHLLIYGIPYLQVDEARFALSPDPEQPLERDRPQLMAAAMDRIRADLRARRRAGDTAPAMVMAHDHISGATRSDSERDLIVGTLSAVPLQVFADNRPDDAAGDSAGATSLSYLALGHLHGRQRPGAGADPDNPAPLHARYSGSPLRFSFSEEHHHKSVAIIDFDLSAPLGHPATLVEQPLVPQPREMVTLEGSIDEICADKKLIARHREAFVRVRLTDTHPENARARLAQHFPYLLAIETPELARTIASGPSTDLGDAPDPLDLIADFFEHAGGRELSEAESATVARLWENVCG